MMKRKYFFFDIDGTLTTHKVLSDIILPSTLQTLKQLQENGHFVAVVSGRPMLHLQPLLSVLPVEYIIYDCGYSILKNKEIYEQKGIDKEVCLKFHNSCIQHKIPYAYFSNENKYFQTSSIQLKDRIELNGHWGKGYKIQDVNIENITITRFLVDEKWYTYNEEKDHTLILNSLDGGLVNVEGNAKWEGVDFLVQQLHAPKEDVVCFGDGYNDIEMIKQAPIGIAMGNAMNEVKQVADFITNNSDEDGVYVACKKFGWI